MQLDKQALDRWITREPDAGDEAMCDDCECCEYCIDKDIEALKDGCLRMDVDKVEYWASRRNRELWKLEDIIYEQ